MLGDLDKGIEFHPVQVSVVKRGRPRIRTEVTLKAYEVYSHVFGKQKAMIEGYCRGGFSVGELIAFLYARSFPKEEWSTRVNEVFKGMCDI